MKNMRLLLAGTLLALNIYGTQGAMAQGQDKGNGGVSVVCRNQAGQITSAQVLDIYEGEVRFGRKYDNTLDADTKVELAQLKLAKYPNFLEEFQQELAKVRAIMIFIPKGNRLLPTNDAFPRIEKIGCDFEQLANYTDESELLVSQEIYDQLDEVNKAALLVHETVYAMFRKNRGAKDSQLSRKLTAHLLAKNADQRLIGTIIEQGFEGTAPGTRACGLEGSLEQRIKNCATKKGNYVLVVRSKEGKEVYKNLQSGLLWGDRLPLDMTHSTAQEACNSSLPEVAGILAAWKLPSLEEYVEAEKNGILRVLPNMSYNFWSLSVHRINSNLAGVFNGDIGYTFYGKRNGKVSVRCVAPSN